ncbi:MAG: hypothetical protein KatS3mg104_2452 [Phycisphaerae bacterium]|nr:MAG: hypothetical protein KatS3mg104_2452 [Phycisphaerae bacterium]
MKYSRQNFWSLCRIPQSVVGLAAVVFSLLVMSMSARATELRVYHIGNSVTDTLRYSALKAMVQANPDRGMVYQYGRHTIPGSPLEYIWNTPRGGSVEPSGQWYDVALPGSTWDVLTLQPFDRPLTNDMDYAQRFINLVRTLPANSNTQVYVYSRWPRRARVAPGVSQWLPINYATAWSKTYNPSSTDINNLENQDYFEQLLAVLRTQNAGTGPEIRMIPVGDVLLEIDQRLRDGRIRGITGNTLFTETPGVLDINILYPDGIHFGNLGQFIVGTTFYATLFKDNPTGLIVPNAYKLASDNPAFRSADFNFPGMILDPGLPSITDQTIADIQQAVWDVVRTHPYAGIPEPTVVASGLIPMYALLRRRRFES